MPTTTIDLEALLAPIPGENPAGESLRYAGLYDEIREARRSDDDLPQGEWKRELKVADWDEVKSLATDALAQKTKDIQVAAWLTEALIKLHGLAGMSDGLQLLTGLLQQYWDSAYPEVEDDDLDARANSLAWLDRQAAIALQDVEMSGAQGMENYTFLQFRKTRLPEEFGRISQTSPDEAARMREAAEKGAEEWGRMVQATPRRFYEEAFTRVENCAQDLQSLDRCMDDKFGRQTPGLSELKKSLEEIQDVLTKIVKEKRLAEPGEVAASPALAVSVGAPVAASSGVHAGKAVENREQALARLAEVADFFHRTEPHSPVSYLVNRAVKWGRMPLEKWLEDVIKDSSVLDQLQEMLGLKTGENS